MDFTCFKTTSIIAEYPGIGFLPILLVNGEEVYRGEYQPTREVAMQRIETVLAKR